MRSQHPRSATRRSVVRALVAAPFILRATSPAHALDGLPALPEQDVVLLRPGDPRYEQSQPVYNLRTSLRPSIRALCLTPTGLRRLIDLARERQIPFALRSGGHSFEGLSQSQSLAIDVRPLNATRFDSASQALNVGAGASLGEIYRAAAKVGMCFPAGSCPTVGSAGHIQGGGYGLLSRALGLASDSMIGADIVDAQGQLKTITKETDPNLHWALSGGGGGTFGAVAGFQLRLHPIGCVLTFTQGFVLPLTQAIQVVAAWQSWAPNAPTEITSILKIQSPSSGRVSLRLAGQSIGQPAQLLAELQRFAQAAGQTISANIIGGSFFEAMDRFSGGWNYESKFSKGKSDFVFKPLTNPAIDTLLRGVLSLPPYNMIVICDSYGGAIRNKRNDESAFAFRDALYCMQYYSSWQNPAQTAQRLTQIRSVYDAMRPHVPGFAYVNYCDLDIKDWQRAYWSSNAQRLRQIKTATDPKNLFRHAQSVTPI